MLVAGADALSREAMNMMPGSSSQRRNLLGARASDESGEIVDAGNGVDRAGNGADRAGDV
jgi:hypothetical protein